MTIKAVFFDMGGTIDTNWYSTEMRLTATPALQEVLTNHGLILHLADEQLYEAISSGLARYHQWRLASMEELPPCRVWRDYILVDHPGDYPQLDAAADDLMVWIETHYYVRQMRPEIPLVLKTLQNNGYKIGLISNVNSRGQVPLNLNQYGIIDYFHPIVLSSEYRRRKPDPAIFHHAARLSNTPTSECIYIGDRVARDILGAKRAGYKMAIQIKHDFKHGEVDAGPTPDLMITNMTELLDVLDNEQKSDRSQPSILPNNRVRAVLFDADGILYYRKNKEREYQRVCKEFGLEIKEFPDAEKERIRRIASIGLITFAEYKAEVLKLLGITDPSQIARGVQIAEEESDNVHFFSDIRETLLHLKDQNLYLGIVTDTTHPLHVKIEKFERGGFGDVWDTIISSREVGFQKPDPEIYQLALQQLGIAPNQAVFVGHKATELEGARRVGMRTIAFNYEPNAKADFYIKQFSDLANLPILNELEVEISK
ncbi:MAG TPA: HAD family hydrolase [Anaerolineales bacterium]|nr:HAD family hydrolase [Anaerolineales bacterium]